MATTKKRSRKTTTASTLKKTATEITGKELTPQLDNLPYTERLYDTHDLGVYEAKLKDMTSAELQEECLRVGAITGNDEQMIYSLQSEFRKYLYSLTPKAKPNSLSVEQEQRIIALTKDVYKTIRL